MILEIDILVQVYGKAMTKINLTNKIINFFIKHAETDYPYECCGFILGKFNKNGSIGIEYIPAENIKEKNKERRFLINPLAYQKAENKADSSGLSVISIVHSHPDHPDQPSDFDLNHAWPGFSYIIISVHKGKAKSYRSWQLQSNREKFIEEKIIIRKDKLNGQ